MTEKQNAEEVQDDFAENAKEAAAMALRPSPPPVDDDLPAEVKKQLVGYADIELENQLVDCVNAIGSLATVDKIVIALWRRHNRKDLDRMKIIRTLNGLAEAKRLIKSDSPRGYRIQSVLPV